MLWKNFKTHWDELIVKHTTFRLVIAVQMLIIITLSLVVVALHNKQRVVFIPPSVDREFWVAGDQFSVSYLEMLGELVTVKVMNVTAANVVDRFNSLLPMVSSGSFSDVKASLTRQAEMIKKSNVSQIFTPAKTVVNEGEKVIAIYGTVRRYVADQPMATAPAVVWIKYLVSVGKFEIQDIQVTKDDKNPFGK